jgi:hypothetical protein
MRFALSPKFYHLSAMLFMAALVGGVGYGFPNDGNGY